MRTSTLIISIVAGILISIIVVIAIVVVIRRKRVVPTPTPMPTPVIPSDDITVAEWDVPEEELVTPFEKLREWNRLGVPQKYRLLNLWSGNIAAKAQEGTTLTKFEQAYYNKYVKPNNLTQGYPMAAPPTATELAQRKEWNDNNIPNWYRNRGIWSKEVNRYVKGGLQMTPEIKQYYDYVMTVSE